VERQFVRGMIGTRSSIGIIFWGLERGEVAVEDVEEVEEVEVVVPERFGLEKMVESFIFATVDD
jgi:hypothetical protein